MLTLDQSVLLVFGLLVLILSHFHAQAASQMEGVRLRTDFFFPKEISRSQTLVCVFTGTPMCVQRWNS